MTFQPGDSITSYIPADIILPEEPEELRRTLNELLKKMIDAINDKDIAHYNTVINLNGQKWFDPNNPQVFKNVFRTVVDFGALPNTGTTSVNHGIVTNANTTFTRIYGTATDPGVATITRAIPIPYVDPAALANGIQLYVDATQVTITTAADYSAYTTCYVVLEWIQF